MDKMKLEIAKDVVDIMIDQALREVLSAKSALQNQLDCEGQTDFVSVARQLEQAIAKLQSLKNQKSLLEQIG